MRLLGAVLAGGRATRFGSDKAAALWRGRPLLAHVVAALAAECEQVVVCGRDEPGMVSLPDRPQLDLGPLGGLNAALAYAAANGFDHVLSAPCDTPRLPRALAASLCADGGAYLAGLPVVGCWPAALAPMLDRHLAAGGMRSIRGWAATTGAIAVDLPDADDLPNINRPADLARLMKDI